MIATRKGSRAADSVPFPRLEVYLNALGMESYIVLKTSATTGTVVWSDEELSERKVGEYLETFIPLCERMTNTFRLFNGEVKLSS